ncbi:hypothetical protein AMAG_18130 [Allomyces macrogynus ATCC 38327]|uniref:Auxin efflux carrier n=1 Tax=Allomyces macrogynus (strain ATCC 38327) TaxID=578462 RepID=A0A0L0S9W6_ALLM3|nr:hypothetical protein AMAG_18130 [Allomyces macrogynus ATCC 38327]|eukprot:KNE59237.1 hypothetical protein AMAG_18130 [Allomyces macrogynus ATCC 38327]
MAVDIGLALGAAARALIKVALSCGAGAVAFRIGLFTVPAMKQMSTLYIKIFLPCLLFTNTAVAISPSNAASAGPLIGVLRAFTSSWATSSATFSFRFLRAKLPRHFQRTLLPVAGIGNHGDLVLSILLTVGNNPPFRQGDAALGIAFVTLFLVPLNVTLFAFGSAAFQADMKHLINEEVVLDEELPQVIVEPPKSDEFDGGELDSLNGRGRSKKRLSIDSPATTSRRYSPSLGPAVPIRRDPDDRYSIPLDTIEPPQLDRKPSISVSVSGVSFSSQRAASPVPSSTRSARPPAWRRIAARIGSKPIMQTLMMPPNFALVLGLLVALIPGVKSVLVPVAGSTTTLFLVPLHVNLFTRAYRRRNCVSFSRSTSHPRGESKEVATVMALQYAVSVVTLTASLTFILAILS